MPASRTKRGIRWGTQLAITVLLLAPLLAGVVTIVSPHLPISLQASPSYAWLVLGAILTCALLVQYGLRRWMYAREFLDEYAGRVLVAICGLYGVAIVSALLMDARVGGRLPIVTANDPGGVPGPESMRPIPIPSWLNLHAPGTLMALCLALVTLIGFTVTLTKLQEAHHQISDYEHLLRRLGRLFEVVMNRKEALNILCTVPTLGNVSYPHAFGRALFQPWKDLADEGEIRIRMVCLDYRPDESLGPTEESSQHDFWAAINPGDKRQDWSDDVFARTDRRNAWRDRYMNCCAVGKFYLGLRERRDFGLAPTRRAFTEAIKVLQLLSRQESGNEIHVYPWREPGASGKFPHLHLFIAQSRAIVATQLDRDLERSRSSQSKVDLVGYETSDERIIVRLTEVFEEWIQELEPVTVVDAPELGAAEEASASFETEDSNGD